MVIAGGDGRFTPLAGEINDLGLMVWAAGHSSSTSRRLAGAVDRVVTLDDDGLAA